MEEEQTEVQPYTYAIGDIHGEVTLLRQLLAMLPLQPEDTLVFLGDYVDRGEDSVATVLALMEVQKKHPHSVFLRGNHEDVWLESWNGECFTHVPHIDGAMIAWKQYEGRIPFMVGDWLAQTQIEYEDEYAYYVHAGVFPDQPVHRTPQFYKLWGDRSFLKSHYKWGKPIVFGHWQMEEPLIQPNKIGIDTGAYRTGILTAVRLPDRWIFQAKR